MWTSNCHNFITVCMIPLKFKYVRDEYWSSRSMKFEPQYVHTNGTHSKISFVGQILVLLMFCAVSVQILVVSIFCSKFNDIMIMFQTYVDFRWIAWKLMKCEHQTWFFSTFFSVFLKKKLMIFMKIKNHYIPSRTFYFFYLFF